MKRLLLPILVLACFSANAQTYVDSHDPNEIKSLLGKENDLAGFGGADLKFGQVLDSRSLIIGGYGGLLVNNTYMLGMAAYGLATDNEFTGFIPGSNEVKNLNLHMGYAGLLLGATILRKEIVHISMPIVFGAGSIDVSDHNFFDQNIVTDTDFTIENSVFFVVEPSLQLEFNITKNFRIAAGASYRWVQGSDLQNINDKELSDFISSVSFRFGKF